jgi:riboflavin synthase
MFTGLIQQKEKILSAQQRGRAVLLTLSRPPAFTDLVNGESIAVNGACLTLVKFSDNTIEFFVGPETVAKTTLGHDSSKIEGQNVNLERSLVLGDRMGGHIVTGHVDDVRPLVSRNQDGECLGLQVSVTTEQLRWVIPKGSVCLNGVSLTINKVDSNKLIFDVLLIPETLSRTNLGDLKVGDMLNIEFDQTVKVIVHQMERYGVQNEQHT